MSEGRATELGGPYHEGVFSEASPPQIVQECGNRLVDAVGHGGEFLGNVAVVIPVVHRAFGTAPNLDEAHASFDEARGEEAALCEVGGGLVRMIKAIGLPGGLRLAHDIEGFGCAELHLCGELVPSNAGGKSRIAGMLSGMSSVQQVQKGESIGIRAAGPIGELLGCKKIGDGLRAVGLDHGALMHGGQEACREAAPTIVGKAACVRQDDEARQVVTEATQCVGNPRTHAGEAWQEESVVEQVGILAMDVRSAGHRLEKSHLIDELGLLREDVADPFAALSVLLELEGAFHQCPLHARRAFDLGFGSEFLSIEPSQRGFVVPGVHGACSAIHEKLDDAFDFCAVMDATVQFGQRLGNVRRSFTSQQMRERDASETSAETVEEIASRGGMWRGHERKVVRSRGARGCACLFSAVSFNG